MKYVLLGIVKLYWVLFPKQKRRHCIFKESCSKYVYRNTNKSFILGILALKRRFQECRSGYTIYKDLHKGTFEVVLSNGRIIKGNKISDKLIPPFSYKYLISDRLQTDNTSIKMHAN